MTRAEIKQLAWVGDEVVKGPIRGVVLSFHGLNVGLLRQEAWPEEIQWGEAGLLTVFPYYGPWSWMSRQVREFLDELVESVYREYSIPDDAALIPYGDSMGGFASLLFSRYSSKPVTRCCAIYPVCDLPYHFNERVDVPRTMRMAYWGYEEPFADVLIEHSPLHQISRMPKVPYLFLHGELDHQVNKQKHSDRMVAEMRQQGFAVGYHEIAGYGHGGPMPPAVEQAKMKFVMGK